MVKRYRLLSPDTGGNPTSGNAPAANADDTPAQAATNTPDAPAADGQETITPEDARKLRSEANALRKREKDALAQLKAYQDKEQQAQDAQLPEIERLKKQVADADSVHTGLVERIVQYEVERAATKLGVIDPDAAARLLDWDALEFDADGMPTNADTLLKDLLKAKPYLAGRAGATSGGATNPARSATGQFSQITRDNLQEAMAQYDKLPAAQQAQVTRLLTSR